jgi:hypothetical protein
MLFQTKGISCFIKLPLRELRGFKDSRDPKHLRDLRDSRVFNAIAMQNNYEL